MWVCAFGRNYLLCYTICIHVFDSLIGHQLFWICKLRAPCWRICIHFGQHVYIQTRVRHLTYIYVSQMSMLTHVNPASSMCAKNNSDYHLVSPVFLNLRCRNICTALAWPQTHLSSVNKEKLPRGIWFCMQGKRSHVFESDIQILGFGLCLKCTALLFPTQPLDCGTHAILYYRVHASVCQSSHACWPARSLAGFT